MSSLLRNLTDERAKRREARLRQLHQERDQREATILAAIPRLAAIKQELAQVGLDLARLALRLSGRLGLDLAALHARGQLLTEERAALLRKHGIDSSQLEVAWDCPICENTGWVKPVLVPGQDTVPHSQKCHCLIQEEIQDLYRFSGLTVPMQSQSFDRFDLNVYPSEYRENNKVVLNVCRRFARGLVEGQEVDNLLLMGDVGRGKTFLATAIANYLVQHHKTAVYFTFPEFLDLLRRQHRDSAEENYGSNIRRLLESDLLILDDLGAEKLTEFVGQEFFNVLNQRINLRKPLVISTNLQLRDLEETYRGRIYSRLVGTSDVLMLKGDDVRLVTRYRSRRGS